MPESTREDLIAAIHKAYGDEGEPDAMLEAFKRAGAVAPPTEAEAERDKLIAAVNKAYGYDPDTEGMEKDAAERFIAFKSAIDRAIPDQNGEQK